MTQAQALWRRLDSPGHDACRLTRSGSGWRLEGAAVFAWRGRPCQLGYAVDCDALWQSRSAAIEGWLGADDVALRIERTEGGGWTLNGVHQPQAVGLIDLDLGFTPATNLLPIRRLALAVGQAMPAPAAWLTFPPDRLTRLEQSYERLDQTRYAYRAPAFDYAAVLTVDSAGLVTDYPGLWADAATTSRLDSDGGAP
jgi:uncharacterized protein